MFRHKNIKIYTLSFVVVLFLVSIASLALLNQSRSDPSVEGESTITSSDITVSATIGTSTKMIVYGYAPSSSTVHLFGSGISEIRNAEVSGWFSFDNIYTTGSTNVFPEVCLIAYIGKLSTQPTCLPSITATTSSYEIGPVILSPIISIENNIFTVGSQVSLNGVTIPSSKVYIYLAENETGLAIVPRALAYGIPKYEVNSNATGKFQFNLPSNITAKWKVFAATTYSSNASPKSNTLNFTVQSNIEYFLKKIYVTIVKTTNIVTTIVTAQSPEESAYKNSKSLEDISIKQIEVVRHRLPYIVIFIEGLILLLIILIILKKRRKKEKESK